MLGRSGRFAAAQESRLGGRLDMTMMAVQHVGSRLYCHDSRMGDAMIKSRIVLCATWFVAGMLSASIAVAVDPSRDLASFDSMPSKSQLADALFRKDIKEGIRECQEIERGGGVCQSVVPKGGVSTSLVNFDRGSANLTDQAKQFLDQFGALLKESKGSFARIVVEGHTDSTGSLNGNRALSKKRADAVKSYLGTNFGITNIETIGRASEDPKDPLNPTAALNRRIEFVVALPGQQ